MILISKYLSILVLMLFEAWFLWPAKTGWQFEWEPLIGMIVSVIAYIGLETKDHAKPSSEGSSTKRISQSDLNLFTELQQMFPADSAAFFRDHDFQTTFHTKPIQPLIYYVDYWTTNDHEFLDSELKAIHKIFRGVAVEFARAVAEFTRPHSEGMATVTPSGHAGGPLPDWAKNEAKQLNELATKFFNAHQEFFHKARKYLHENGKL